MGKRNVYFNSTSTVNRNLLSVGGFIYLIFGHDKENRHLSYLPCGIFIYLYIENILDEAIVTRKIMIYWNMFTNDIVVVK